MFACVDLRSIYRDAKFWQCVTGQLSAVLRAEAVFDALAASAYAYTMIDKLEFLLYLAQEKHFGRAAEAAGVTQPTLSSAVKSLEDQFGLQIVERGSRFRGFTVEGERVLEWARKLVGDARTMRKEIEALKRGLTGHLRLGVIPTALSFVAELTVPFRARYPDVSFTVFSLSSEAVLDRLENLEIDAGLTYTGNESLRRLQSVPLYEEHYALLVRPDSPLAARDAITWREACELPLCLLTPEMQNRRIIDGHLADAGGTRKPTLESNSMLVLYSHVRSGEWVSIIPARFAQTFDEASLLKAVALVEPAVTHQIGLVMERREPHSPALEAFKTQARRLAARLTSGGGAGV